MMGKLQQWLQAISLVILLLLNGIILKFITNLDLFSSTKKTCLPSECKSDPNQMEWGFDKRFFEIAPTELKNGQILGDLFNADHFSGEKLRNIISNIAEHISLKSLKTGAHYAFVSSNPCAKPDYFVYRPNAYQYLISDLNQDGCSQLIDKELISKEESVVGVIKTTLWDALQEQGVSLNIIDQMEDALSASMDFHHVQTGNTFKLIFHRNYVENTPTNDGKLLAAYFNTNETDHFAFRHSLNGKEDFYDLAGRPMRRSFLSAPVRFSRISSPFSSRRFHPVLKYHRAHLGTDYAAPHGTPIMAVGDGVVEAAHYAGGNGNFVKIRHDKTYQTQYLHMSRFASGIRPGTYVKQGQTIGYVGSTGLASGPHVCFRFWKNGSQVDHRRLSFPNPEPLSTQHLPDYIIHRDSMIKKLDVLKLPMASNPILNKTS